MFKKTVVAALMGMCSLAHADFYRIEAIYTGFNDINGNFQAGQQLRMRAIVDDANNNGVFTTGELRTFYFGELGGGGIGIGQGVMAPGRCVHSEWSARYGYCMGSFNYTASGALSFDAGDYSTDPDATISSDVTSGQSYWTYLAYRNNNPSRYITMWNWTPETQVSITVTAVPPLVPVPEPATYAMLGAGLLAIGAVARRRRGR